MTSIICGPCPPTEAASHALHPAGLIRQLIGGIDIDVDIDSRLAAQRSFPVPCGQLRLRSPRRPPNLLHFLPVVSCSWAEDEPCPCPDAAAAAAYYTTRRHAPHPKLQAWTSVAKLPHYCSKEQLLHDNVHAHAIVGCTETADQTLLVFYESIPTSAFALCQ